MDTPEDAQNQEESTRAIDHDEERISGVLPAERPSATPDTPVSGSAPDLAPEPAPAPAAPQPMKRPPVQYQPAEPGWWLGADGLWYPPETAPGEPRSGPVISNPATGSQNVVVNVTAPRTVPAAYVSAQPKSKVAAGLLGIFLGVLGIHRFYLGNVGLGLTMLLLTVLSLGFLSPLVATWGLIEGIVLLAGGIKTDSRGIPLV